MKYQLEVFPWSLQCWLYIFTIAYKTLLRENIFTMFSHLPCFFSNVFSQWCILQVSHFKSYFISDISLLYLIMFVKVYYKLLLLLITLVTLILREESMPTMNFWSLFKCYGLSILNTYNALLNDSCLQIINTLTICLFIL